MFCHNFGVIYGVGVCVNVCGVVVCCLFLTLLLLFATTRSVVKVPVVEVAKRTN